MHVFSKPRLREFWQSRNGPERQTAEVSLTTWYKTTSAAVWRNWGDLKQTFGRADLVRAKCPDGPVEAVVVDVGGNKYRVIATVRYVSERYQGKVVIREVLDHGEYDREEWKKRLCAKG